MYKKIKSFFKKILFSKKEKLDLKKVPFFTKDFEIYRKHIIGDYTYGNPCLLFENQSTQLKVGKFCSIANGVTIFLGGNHRTDWITTYPFNDIPNFFEEVKHIKGHPATKGNVEIGNDVWIGYGVILLSGVKIADGAIVAAGSVVSKNIGAYEVWGGNPAQMIKKRFSESEIQELLKIRWWDWTINEIIDNAESLCSTEITKFIKNKL